MNDQNDYGLPEFDINTLLGAIYSGGSQVQNRPNQDIYNAGNVPILQMPWVIVTLDGAVFFRERRLAEAFASRELARGNELELLLCQTIPVARISSVTGPITIQETDAEGKAINRPSLPASSDSQQESSTNG